MRYIGQRKNEKEKKVLGYKKALRCSVLDEYGKGKMDLGEKGMVTPTRLTTVQVVAVIGTETLTDTTEV